MTLYRDMAYVRTQNYADSGDFLASEVNTDFDNLWLAGEQTNRSFSQSIRKPITDSDSISMELPEAADRANSFLTFDATGAPTVTSVGDPGAPSSIVRQQFTGDGTTTAFTLASAPGALGQSVQIFIDGVYQENDTYSISGTTLTFTEAPPVNASIETVRFEVNDIGETSANLVSYTPAGTGAVDTTVQTKLRESVSVKDFGAVGDGVTDDTAAIQAALDTGKPTFIPHGKYKITSELTWSDGSYLFGQDAAFFHQSSSNPPATGTVAELFYDGAGGSNSAVCRMSKVAVGTKPTYQADESETLRHAGISGVYVNGNNKAEYGVYSARAGYGNIYQNVAVTNTKEHGFWFGELFGGRLINLIAIHNYGRGISIGQDTFTWSGGNNINSVFIETLIAFLNGRALSSWTESDYEDGYGIGLYLGRNCECRTLDSEFNEGVGIVWQPTSGPSTAHGIYAENNCYQYPSSSERYQIWYQSNSSSINHELNGLYFLFNHSTPSGNTNAPRLKIKGTPPAEDLQVPVFKRIVGDVVVDAEMGEYRVENHAPDTTTRYIANFPQFNDPDTITAATTTLYVDDNASGDGSGRDTSNYAILSEALKVASVVSSVTTIDVSAQTFRAPHTIDGKNIRKNLLIDGGGTGRFDASGGTALTITNWSTELTIHDMLVVDRTFIKNSKVNFDDCPIIRMDSSNTAGAALNLENSNVQVSGTSKLNLSASSATAKIGVDLQDNSQITFNNAAANTISSYSTNRAIDFSDGSGIVRVSEDTTTATWAVAVTYNSGGEGGCVIAPNGIKVGTSAGAFL